MGTSKKSLLYSGDDIFCPFKAPKAQFSWLNEHFDKAEGEEKIKPETEPGFLEVP